MMKFVGSVILLLSFVFCSVSEDRKIVVGAEQPEEYLSLLKNKKVGLVVNHTSIAGKDHLVDFLLSNNIDVEKIFAPEHGFRGDASAGAEIADGEDKRTGIPIFSLYGKTKKPTKAHLENLDAMIFDIQDVGCRFYTYISTLHYVIEACAENKVSLLVFDRPNPNGDYVAGPVLEQEFQSFVGMHPIPIVHGLTVGELASMIVGERWHSATQKCDLTVIPVKNYTHLTLYDLPVKPSPNLPNYLSIRLYPSLCFFEATSVSVGRGTDFPFQVLGGLQRDLGNFSFIPKSVPGAATNPLNKGKECFGIDLREETETPQFSLQYFMKFYSKYKNESDFLIREQWFGKLAGTGSLIIQIRAGKSEAEIIQSWQTGINEYKKYVGNIFYTPILNSEINRLLHKIIYIENTTSAFGFLTEE